MQMAVQFEFKAERKKPLWRPDSPKNGGGSSNEPAFNRRS